MTYKTTEKITDHKGVVPAGTKLILASKWYKGKQGRFAMFKAPSLDGVLVFADESQLTRRKQNKKTNA